ncbi:phosphoacetylglucosamine mutase-like [Alnus glutinosa]|uniref:phosphoacetylglucosamine mutase-like n=1 Tax=Alnus glutinosa TaxID=3517 RepID=UPI002D770CB9|nr:phosphoacetylglucosamine mutase-like [Alnus glutinosa]
MCSSYHARLGVVQTAHVNGVSTDYPKKLGLEIVFTPTGVKYLHEKAAEYVTEYETSQFALVQNRKKAPLRLLAVSKLINQAVGDALSGLLLVEAILQHMGWSRQRWSELYKDLLSRQLKLITEFLEKENIPLEEVRPVAILSGRDTRPSGESLLEPAKQGISSILGVFAIHMGIVTTPQVHWMVRARNKGINASELVDEFLGLGSP